MIVDDKEIEITGKYLRVATVYDEMWKAGQIITNPFSFIAKFKKSKLKADIFTFAQKIPDCKPKYRLHFEWDNLAAIPLTTYEDWWTSVSTGMRKDVKRAKKQGITTKRIEFNDKLIQNVIEINNESEIRQGRQFVHYGKNFDTVKKEYSTYLDQCEFLGAFYNGELVGLIKMVFAGELACIMEFLAKNKFQSKRPNNALIAKAVETCINRKKSYLTYGPFYYGNKKKSSMVDFKKRCGFEQIIFPRYYIPLTLKGSIAISFKLQLGLLGLLPGSLISFLKTIRSFFYTRKMQKISKNNNNQ